jgi:hypothetical protein
MSAQPGTKPSTLWSVSVLNVCLSTEFNLQNSSAISGHVYEDSGCYDGIISFFGLVGPNVT